MKLSSLFAGVSVIGVCFVLMSGCSQSEISSDAKVDSRSRAYSAVSTRAPYFNPKPGASFSVYYDRILMSDSDPLQVSEDMKAFLLQQVIDVLRQRGYTLAEHRDSADYVIGVAIASNAANNSGGANDIGSYFQVSPGIVLGADEREASVTVAVVNNEPWLFAAGQEVIREHLLWRSSVGAVIFEELDLQQRQHRVQHLVHVLMGSLP